MGKNEKESGQENITEIGFNGFNTIQSSQNFESLIKTINSVTLVFDECCKIYKQPAKAIKHLIPCNYFFEFYKFWCKKNNVTPTNKIAFGMRLRQLKLPIRKKRMRYQGEQLWIYEGLEILPEIYKEYLENSNN